MSDLDLRDLNAFLAVARTRNFRRAALDERVSVSSLSQRLRDMEERLGVRLLNRTTRSVALTEAGELLLARVGPAMSEVTDALERVRGLREVPSGRLRINAPPPAVDLVLAPMVAPFLRAYPQVDIEIVGQSGFIDIVDGGYDAGVRYGEHLEQDMIAIPLGPPQRYALVAAPDYLARHGRPKHPRDLLDHACIRIRLSSGAMLDWEFEKAGRAVKLSPAAKLVVNYPGPAMRAARDGVGFWLTFRVRVRGDRFGRSGQRARRLVCAVSGTVPVLPEPPPAAAGTRGVHRFRRRVAEAGAEEERRVSRVGMQENLLILRKFQKALRRAYLRSP